MRTVSCLLLAVFVAACQGDPQPPAVDVTGVWTGTWQGAGNVEHGFVVLSLVQEADGAVGGEVYLRYDFPTTTNIGVNVKGRVEGHAVTITMQSSNNPHTFHGQVDGEAASGSLDYRGLTGDWSAQRLPTTTLQIETSFEADVPQPRAITLTQQVLWATNGAALYRVDTSSRKVERIDPSPSSPTCDGLAHDSKGLLCSGGSPKIYQLDFTGQDLGSFVLDDKTWPDLLAFDDKDLWVSQGIDYTLRRVDMTGKVLDKLTLKASIGDMTWRDQHLYLLLFSPRVVLKVDRAGKMVAGYQLPPELIERTDSVVAIPDGIAADGDSLWICVERHEVEPTPGPTQSKTRLYRMKMP